MRNVVLATGLIATGVLLTGCVGGTTYGTGVSHEQQTLEGISNIFSLSNKSDRKKIDYSARPDLVQPANKETLPDPVEVEASTSNPAWPETPGERIARIRGDAITPDERSGEIPLEELLRKKEGIGIDRRKVKTGQELDRDGHEMINEIGSGKDKRHKEAKKKLAYSVGAQRKYLTEPPNEYRVPEATAVAGDQGLDRRIIDEKKKKEDEYKTDLLRGRD